jgi:hypothetical protein
MAKIPVPKPAKGSFNKDRPASDLLRAQMRHLYEVEKQLPHRHRTGHNIEAITTEAQASEYIRRVTTRLHLRGKIEVPRAEAGSFHKHRPVSDLLKKQIEHFREAEMRLRPETRTGIDVNSIKTEEEAGIYIRKITAILHPQEVKKAGRRS